MSIIPPVPDELYFSSNKVVDSRGSKARLWTDILPDYDYYSDRSPPQPSQLFHEPCHYSLFLEDQNEATLNEAKSLPRLDDGEPNMSEFPECGEITMVELLYHQRQDVKALKLIQSEASKKVHPNILQ